MLWATVVILLVLWLRGVPGSCLRGGSIHALPVIALVATLVQPISGQRTVA